MSENDAFMLMLRLVPRYVASPDVIEASIACPRDFAINMWYTNDPDAMSWYVSLIMCTSPPVIQPCSMLGQAITRLACSIHCDG